MNWNQILAGRMSRMKASEIRELLKLLDQPDIISFAGGIPDPALFPADAFREAMTQALSKAADILDGGVGGRHEAVTGEKESPHGRPARRIR